MSHQQQRLLFIDIMRGLAVVTMVMGHTIDAVLDAGLRGTEWFRIYNFFRGFTAPVFLFVSGLAFSVATEKRWSEYLHFSSRLRTRVGKIVLLFVIGYALHLPFFSFDRLINGASSADIGRWLQVDVLHCVAGTMVVLHGLVLLTRTPVRFASATLVMFGVVMLLTPLVWRQDLSLLVSPFFSPYLNQHQTSIFPLFPYAAFMLAGVVTGHYYLRSQELAEEREFFFRLITAGGAVGVLSIAADLIPVSLYPEHDFWKTSPVFLLFRLAVLFPLTGAFFLVIRLPKLLEKHLTIVGRSSLLIYTLHIVIVYGSVLNPGLMQIIGQTFPPLQSVAAGLCVLTTMLLVAIGWSHLHSRHFIPVRFAQAALAGGLLFVFLVSPG